MSPTKRVTRRRFLQQGTQAAAAAVAVPCLVPGHVLAAEGRPGANDRIGVGYVGAGRRARQLMNLPAEGQIVAICDVYFKRAEGFAVKHRATAYQDYREMLDSPDVDAVIVATPDHWHALPSIHACQAGKDVYCEKPLALTVREGQLMVKAARKHGRVFQTGTQQRSMATNRLGCELIRNGRIGKIERVIGSNYPSPWQCDLPAQPVPDTLDWNAWCGQTEPRPYHADIYTPRANPGWISFRPYSGGEMTGWGAHGLDQVQWALGTDGTGPVEIWSEGGKLDEPIYSEPESRDRGNQLCSEGHQVHLRYESGVVLTLSHVLDGGGLFIGEKGQIAINRNSLDVDPPELAEEPLTDADIRFYKSDDHLQNWFDCIRSRERAVADVEFGHRSATICHLANITRWLGRKLHWNPETETFAGDDEANALLERPQRKPYQLPEIV